MKAELKDRKYKVPWNYVQRNSSISVGNDTDISKILVDLADVFSNTFSIYLCTSY